MTTALRIVSGIFVILAGLLYHFNFNPLSFIFSICALASLLMSLFTHRKEELSKHRPLKIIFLNETEVYKVKYDGECNDWNKIMKGLISFPLFPEGMKKIIQTQGFASFILLDLEKKKKIRYPKRISHLNTGIIALVHKDFMPDLTISMRAWAIYNQHAKE